MSELRQYAEAIRTQLTSKGSKRLWQWAFLEVLARSGNVTLACYAAETDRQNAYQLRNRDADFRELWDAALEMAADRLEEEAWRRALEGVERYVVSQGKIVMGPDGKPLIEEQYSDMLLDRLLRAHRPEKFRDSYGVVGGSVTIVKVYDGFNPDEV
ncbi:MAG TPA: hypothetical protein VHI13_09395 [Candidatus Kapabacteria bacterium]|nr:hypothetical protein [Candidatus Kapabacteria bacterium]